LTEISEKKTSYQAQNINLVLVALSVLAGGQFLPGRKAELHADEQFRITMSTYHDIEEIIPHFSAQDAELLKHTKMLIHLLNAAGITQEQLPDVQISGATSLHETPSAGTQE